MQLTAGFRGADGAEVGSTGQAAGWLEVRIA